jgi:hypothetical protein
LFYPVYLERTSVLDFVGAASSRDRFNSRLEAAPTGVFYYLSSLRRLERTEQGWKNPQAAHTKPLHQIGYGGYSGS